MATERRLRVDPDDVTHTTQANAHLLAPALATALLVAYTAVIAGTATRLAVRRDG
jgi:hypothetical protein